MRTLTPEDRQAISRHAQHASPFECCGVITETGVIACKNIARNRVNEVRIGPEEMKQISRRNKIVGFYHSHVDRTTKPSAEDIALAHYRDLGYVIASVSTFRGGFVTEIAHYELSATGFHKNLVKKESWHQ